MVCRTGKDNRATQIAKKIINREHLIHQQNQELQKQTGSTIARKQQKLKMLQFLIAVILSHLATR
jgi:cell fate (sporulation/competence/biofilm development) regulator YmcA (YheA/YmcA/DUF963 family)